MHNYKHFMSSKDYAKTFFKWLFLSTVIGLLCGGIGVLFHFLVEEAAHLFAHNNYLLYLLPVFGIIIAWLYRKFKMENDMGTNTIFESIRTGQRPPLRMAPLIFIGTVLTHLGGGSSGREGAALQIGGSVASAIGTRLSLNEKDLRIITLCGMSAVFSALFGTPLTATIFCIEVISVGIIHFSALLPCLTSALAAYYIAGKLGISPVSFNLETVSTIFDIKLALLCIVLAIGCAFVSILLCETMHISHDLYKKYFKHPYLRISVAGILVIILTLLSGTRDYNGAGMNIVTLAIAGSCVPWAFALKLLFTGVTLGGGYRGGEIVPTMFIGATFGCFLGGLLGLNPGFAAAIGLVAVFCGAVNCPISSLILSIELFGSGNILYFAIACGVSYMLSGKFSLYKSQKIIYSKLEPTYICKSTDTLNI